MKHFCELIKFSLNQKNDFEYVNYNTDDDETGNLNIRNAENTRNDTCVRACDFHEDQPK